MRILLYIIFLLVFELGTAQSTDTNYKVKWLDAKVGLNQLSIKNCVPDDAGFLWIATELGLYRYDGNSVSLALENNLSSINSQRIFCLVKDYKTSIIYFIPYPDLKYYSISNGTIKEVKDTNKVGFFNSSFPFFNTKNGNYNSIRETLKKNYFLNNQHNYEGCSSVATNNFFYYLDPYYISCIDSKGVTTKITRSKSFYYSFLKFGSTVLGVGASKIDVFENNRLKDTNISYDKVIYSYNNRNEKNYPYSRIFLSNKKYFLNFNGNIYEILYKDKKVYTQFLFKSPLNIINGFSYSEKENSYFLSSSTKGIAIVKPKKINVFTTNNDNLDNNYVVVENNNNWYSYNGWQYNRYTNQYKIRKRNDYLGNMRFLLTFNNNIYVQVKENRLRSIQDGVSYAPLKIHKKFNFLSGFTYFKNKLW